MMRGSPPGGGQRFGAQQFGAKKLKKLRCSQEPRNFKTNSLRPRTDENMLTTELTMTRGVETIEHANAAEAVGGRRAAERGGMAE